ncbi:type IV pilus modification PilV family protein [Kangiella marina]
MNNESGFSLLEALITVLVISIGLLGYAALQMGALNSSVDSFSRSQATTLLENAAARIGNNTEYLRTDSLSSPNHYVGNQASGTPYTWCDTQNNSFPEAECGAGDACSGDKLAKQDIYEVCRSLENTKFPAARIGATCFDLDTTDTDSCSYGSRLSLYMSWQGVERKDVSGKAAYAQNTRCQQELGLGSDYSCVQLELVP